jgi:ketosteroid isomerase-like protein
MHAQDSVTTADTILDLVWRWTDAERSLDAQALAPLLADDFILVGPRGFMLGKQQFLNSRR